MVELEAVVSFQCKNCGSQSHQAFDCPKPYNGWREREPLPKPASNLKNAPERSQAPVITVLQADSGSGKEGLLPNQPGYRGQVKREWRRGFPFLRESTRREMDERIGRATAPKPDAMDLPKVNREPVALPKREKKQQETLFKL